MIFGLTIFAGICALATYIKLSEPDNQLYELFALAQVIMVGSLGLSIFTDAADDFKKQFIVQKAKRKKSDRQR